MATNLTPVDRLSGAALDYYVAKAEGLTVIDDPDEPGPLVLIGHVPHTIGRDHDVSYCPSQHWAEGGPIIARNSISLLKDDYDWWAFIDERFDMRDGGTNGPSSTGPTPLIAAMRAYVISQFGEAVPAEIAL